MFNKRQGLYALNFAKKERNLGRLVLVEGYMDTVSLRKYGVAGRGGHAGHGADRGAGAADEALRPRGLDQLRRRRAPGSKAALRALDIFDSQDMKARVIDYPGGHGSRTISSRPTVLAGFDALPKYGATEYRMMRARDDLDVSTQEGMTQYAMRCCEILQKGAKAPSSGKTICGGSPPRTGYDREMLLSQMGVIAAARRPHAPAARAPPARKRPRPTRSWPSARC